jgi:hypothetical protein
MKLAAYKMTTLSESNKLELLPSCDSEDVLLANEKLKMIELGKTSDMFDERNLFPASQL